jgi:hypothetical protein
MILFETSAKAGRDKLKFAFVEAFAGPFGEVVKLITSSGGTINNALQSLIRGAGKLFQELINLFSGKVIVNLADTSNLTEFQKAIVKTWEAVKAFGAGVRLAVDGVIRPAFQRLRSIVSGLSEADLFSGLQGGIVEKAGIIVGALSVIHLWFGLLFKMFLGVRLRAFALTRVILVLAAALLSLAAGADFNWLKDVEKEFGESAEGLIATNKNLYSRLVPDATAGAKQTTGVLAGFRDNVAKVLSDIDATFKGISGVSIGAIIKNDGSAENIQSLERVRAIYNEIKGAIVNAVTETTKFFTSTGSGGTKLVAIFQKLVDVFNYFAGTNFTAGGFAVVLLFTAWLGVLLPLLKGLGALATILAGITSIIFTVIPAVAKFGAGLVVLIARGGKAALAFLTAGSAMTKFGRIALLAIRGVMVAITGLLGWPALLIAGLGLVYAYWDQIVAAAKAAWDVVTKFVGQLWDGFVDVAKTAWNGVKTIATETWNAIKTVATETWNAITTVGKDSWAGIKTVAQETWDSISQIGRDSWNGIKTVATDVWSGLTGVASRYWSGVRSIGAEAWEGIKAAATATGNLIAKALGLTETDQSKIEKELVDPFRAAVEAVNQLMTVDLPAYVENGLGAVISAMERMASAVETQVRRIEEAVSRAKEAAASMPSGGGDGAPFASGGYVRGPGSGTSDSIPAWLSNGEFVIRAAAVRQYGVSFLRAVNGMALSPRALKMGSPAFAMGGLVGAVPVPAMAGGGQLPGKSFDLHIGGDTFSGLYAPEQTAARLMQYATQAQVRSAGRKPGWVR